MNRPNIVLIVADQFRGDCLGIAGHPDVKTPYLDTLASRGAYCCRIQWPWDSCGARGASDRAFAGAPRPRGLSRRRAVAL